MKLFVALNKLPLAILAILALALAPTSAALAHVTVKPGEVATAQYQVFTVSVPNEKTIPTVAVKLVVPDEIDSITPTNKSGWEIDIEKSSSDDDARVVSVTWSDGQIADGLRDEFSFSAKTPDSPTELNWKAYQTYSDETVVAWDQAESDDHGHGGDSGPFSVTNVTDTVAASHDQANPEADRALYVAAAGVIVGLIAIFLATRKK